MMFIIPPTVPVRPVISAISPREIRQYAEELFLKDTSPRFADLRAGCHDLHGLVAYMA